MNASKENADRAIAVIGTLDVPAADKRSLLEFLEAARRKLPYEAAYEKQRRKGKETRRAPRRSSAARAE